MQAPVLTELLVDRQRHAGLAPGMRRRPQRHRRGRWLRCGAGAIRADLGERLVDTAKQEIVHQAPFAKTHLVLGRVHVDVDLGGIDPDANPDVTRFKRRTGGLELAAPGPFEARPARMLSGLIGALSPETGTFCLEIARTAKKHGTRISFDLNHRCCMGSIRTEGRIGHVSEGFFPANAIECHAVSHILLNCDGDVVSVGAKHQIPDVSESIIPGYAVHRYGPFTRFRHKGR